MRGEPLAQLAFFGKSVANQPFPSDTPNNARQASRHRAERARFRRHDGWWSPCSKRSTDELEAPGRADEVKAPAPSAGQCKVQLSERLSFTNKSADRPVQRTGKIKNATAEVYVVVGYSPDYHALEGSNKNLGSSDR